MLVVPFVHPKMKPFGLLEKIEKSKKKKKKNMRATTKPCLYIPMM